MSKRIRLWLIAALALCAAAAVGVTLSFMFKKAEKTNTFVPAKVTCDVEESLFSGVKSDVCVKNTGNVAAYLRIRLVSYYVDDNGDIAFTDLLMNNPDGYTFDQAQVLYLVANWMPTEQDDSYLKINYTEDAIEAINLWSSTGDSAMTIPQAAQPGGDDMMEIFTMASDSLTYLSTVAPKVILGTATADDYRAAVEECMNGMNLDVITEKYQAAYDEFMGN